MSSGEMYETIEILNFNERCDRYIEAFNFARIEAMIANVMPKKNKKTYHPRDFVGKAPWEEVDMTKGEIKKLMSLAKSKGMEVPDNAV